MGQYRGRQTGKKVTCAEADHHMVVHLLADKFVLTEGVSSFSGQCVHWTFVNLLLDRSVQQEQRLTSTLLYTQRGCIEG